MSVFCSAEEHTRCVAVLRSAKTKLLIQRLATLVSTCSLAEFVSYVRASR